MFFQLQTAFLSLQGLNHFFDQACFPRNFLFLREKVFRMTPSYQNSCISVALTIPQTVQPSEHLQQLYSASQTLDPHDQHELLFCLQTELHGAHWSEVGTGDSLFHSLTYNTTKKDILKNISDYSKLNTCIKIILKCCVLQASKSKTKALTSDFFQASIQQKRETIQQSTIQVMRSNFIKQILSPKKFFCSLALKEFSQAFNGM